MYRGFCSENIQIDVTMCRRTKEMDKTRTVHVLFYLACSSLSVGVCFFEEKEKKLKNNKSVHIQMIHTSYTEGMII